MLVDGLGDGLMLEGPFDLSFLRTTSFGTLQVRASSLQSLRVPYLFFLPPSVC